MADDASRLLAGRTAVVSGASRGIGRAIALELARSGARVHALARDRPALDALTSENANVVAQPGDLGDTASLDALFARLQGSGSAVDLLVHCAGSISHAPTASADLAELDEMMQINFRGAYRLTQMLLPAITENRGDIAFINSSVTQFPRAASGQFAATQHALIGFANSLREEVNAAGVRVLSIYPGRTDTPRQERLQQASGERVSSEFMLQPQDVADVLVAAIGLPRRAEVTEIRIRPAAKKL